MIESQISLETLESTLGNTVIQNTVTTSSGYYVLKDIIKYFFLRDSERDDILSLFKNREALLLLLDEFYQKDVTVFKNRLKTILDESSPKLSIILNKECSFDQLDGYQRLNIPNKPIEQYLSSDITAKVFKRNDSDNILVLIDRITSTFMRKLTSAIVVLFPHWIKTPLTDKEKDCLREISVGNKRSESEIDYLLTDLDKKICELKTYAICDGFENNFVNNQIALAKRFVEDSQNHINRLEEDLKNELERRRQAEFNLQSAYLMVGNKAESFVKFISKRHSVTPLRRDDNKILLSIVEPIEYFDKDLFERIENNPDSYIGRDKKSYSKEINLLHDLFVEEIGSLVCECRFWFSGSTLSPVKYYNWGGELEYIPHPHLGYFGCLGENAVEISKYSQQGNWGMIIDQGIIASKNINFNDVTVMENLITNIPYWYDKQIIMINKTGELVTPNQFFEMRQKGEI